MNLINNNLKYNIFQNLLVINILINLKAHRIDYVFLTNTIDKLKQK